MRACVRAPALPGRSRFFARTIQDADIVAVALEHYRRSPALGLCDCLILEVARKADHLPLGTFDRALQKLDRAENAVIV
jgi:predicted nucleic acid-binding protein